jgi:hypothetical protein
MRQRRALLLLPASTAALLREGLLSMRAGYAILFWAATTTRFGGLLQKLKGGGRTSALSSCFVATRSGRIKRTMVAQATRFQ